jgi:hypothetical protein
MTSQRPPFRKFLDLGYKRLVPIIPPDAAVYEKSSLAKRLSAGIDSRGKAPGVKRHDGTWMGLDWMKVTPTDADLELWADMGAGVGIRTGEGLIALDIDSTNDLIAHQAMKLAKEMLGPAPHRIGRWPKVILVYRTLDPVPYQRVEFTQGGKNERIELLSEGKQFVAHGTHPTAKKPYEWPDGITKYDQLQAVSAASIEAYFAELAKVLPASTRATVTAPNDRTRIDQTSLTGDEALIKKAVGALPNTTELFPTYDDYIRVGAAIKGATQHNPQLGEELFLQWAGRWEGGNDPDASLADYGRIKAPFELGARWLYDMAARYNPQTFNPADIWFTEIPSEPEPLFPTTPANDIKATGPKRILKVYSTHELADSYLKNPASPLIKGLLDQQAFSVIYGRSNSGKTFLAMDMAFHIATGLPWGGMRTAKLPALYIVAEGSRGVAKRVQALNIKYPTANTELLKLVMATVDLFDPEADVGAVIHACKSLEEQLGHKVGFIVVDTLARAMAGGDENSSKDMSVFVKNIDVIRESTGAHVMVVHHSGKDASRGARGSNALLAAVDTELEVADNVISTTKQRDLDREFSVRFALDIIPLGADQDGEPLSSCVVRLLEDRQVEIGIATPKEKDIFEALETLANLNPAVEDGVAMADIVAFMDSSPAKMGKEAVRFHLKALAAKGLIVRAGRGKWKVQSGGKSGGSYFEIVEDGDEAEESGGESGGSVFA